MYKDYFRYEITNGLRVCIGGADNLKEARKFIRESLKDDKDHGFKTSREDYHIFMLNRRTGERLKEVV